MKYTIMLNKEVLLSKIVEVEADNDNDARRFAFEIAYDLDFSDGDENRLEYSQDIISKVE